MKKFRLAIAALAAFLTLGIACADEREPAIEVVVVKGQRPAEAGVAAPVAPTPAALAIDLSKLAIEPPAIEPKTKPAEPRRIELTTSAEKDSKG